MRAVLVVVTLVAAGCGKDPPPTAREEKPSADPAGKPEALRVEAKSQETKSTQAPNPTRAKAGLEGVTINGVRVDVLWAGTERQGVEDGDVFEVIWSATTRDDSRRYQCRGWRSDAKLADRLGNTYPTRSIVRFDLAAGTVPPAAQPILKQLSDTQSLGRLSLFPGQVTSQLGRYGDLFFEVPVKAAGVLDLDLGGDGVGVAGTFRFEIDVKEFAPPAPPKVSPPRDPRKK